MIRSITADDAPAVRALQTQLAYSDPELIDAAIDGPFLGAVAVGGDRVVGYAIALPGQPLTVSELVVAPDARRAGHGRALINAVASAAGSNTVVVMTPPENRTARRFYADIGFEVEGRQPAFYTDGADALRLVRRK